MESNKKTSPAERWLDAATGGIRFGPDRAAVRAELAEHLEDKTLDFLRIFPGLTEAEAGERAAAAMGDPEEIGRELAKVHRPWLGWLWRASQVLLGLGLGGVLLTGYMGAAVDDVWDIALEEPAEPLVGIPFSAQRPVHIHHYTLWVERAVLEESTGELILSWRVVSPCFWERPNGMLSQGWTAADDQGTDYSSLWERSLQNGQWSPFVSSLVLEDALVGWTGEQSIHMVPLEAQWVRIDLKTGGAEPISLLLEREEGTR